MGIKLNPPQTIITRLNLEEGGKVHKKLASRSKQRMEKYVPKLTETLRKTARVDTSDCSIHYEQVYAGYQYYGQRRDGTHKITKHHIAGTGPYWDKKMLSAEGKDLEREINRFVQGKGI